MFVVKAAPQWTLSLDGERIGHEDGPSRLPYANRYKQGENSKASRGEPTYRGWLSTFEVVKHSTVCYLREQEDWERRLGISELYETYFWKWKLPGVHVFVKERKI